MKILILCLLLSGCSTCKYLPKSAKHFIIGFGKTEIIGDNIKTKTIGIDYLQHQNTTAIGVGFHNTTIITQ